MRRAAAILLTVSSASGMMLAARVPTRVPAVRMAYTDVVRAAQERAAAVKADQAQRYSDAMRLYRCVVARMQRIISSSTPGAAQIA